MSTNVTDPTAPANVVTEIHIQPLAHQGGVT